MNNGLGHEFMAYVTGILATHVDTKVHVMASLIAGPVALSVVVTLVFWALRMARGHVQEPVGDTGIKITVIVIYMALSTSLWLWDAVIADFVFNAAGWLTAGIVGTTDPLAVPDKVWFDMNLVAESLSARAGVFTGAGIMFAISAWLVYILGCLASLIIIAMYLTSTVMVHLLAIFAPIIFWLMMFESTRRYFENWVTQLVTYSITPLMLAIVATMLLKFLGDYAVKAAANADVTLTDVGFMIGIVIIICYVGYKCEGVASSLAGGLAMSGMGALGELGARVFHTAKSTAYLGARGAADGWRGEKRSPYQPVRRNLANHAGQLAHSAFVRNGGQVVPRYERLAR